MRGPHNVSPSINRFTPAYEFTHMLGPKKLPVNGVFRLAGTPPVVDQNIILADLCTILDPLMATIELNPTMDQIHRLFQDVEEVVGRANRGGDIYNLRSNLRKVAYGATVTLDVHNG